MTDVPRPPSGVLPSDLTWRIESLENLPDHHVDLEVGRGIRARLRRYRRASAKPVVLLVHGASAGSRTFMVPQGGLIRYLVERDFDVWTLDWRSSNLFTVFNPLEVRRAAAAELRESASHGYWRLFNLDNAAEYDLVRSLEAIGEWIRMERAHDGAPTIGVMAHCVGGAVVAQALATGLLTRPDAKFRLGPCVLTTLALFYRVGVEGWLKGNEFLLEELTTAHQTFADPEHPVITPILPPDTTWPDVLESAFQTWRQTPFAPNGWGGTPASEFVERIAFMYGMPYHTKRLSKTLSPNALMLQFGDMPLGIYMHCVRNLRVGYATRFDATDDRYISTDHILPDGVPAVPLTLLTGADNQVWHRDSIDRTYEWLVNQTKPSARRLLKKRVFTGYAHQDLLWSDDSPSTIYPDIASGLLRRAESD
jgi:hypothetical protein